MCSSIRYSSLRLASSRDTQLISIQNHCKPRMFSKFRVAIVLKNESDSYAQISSDGIARCRLTHLQLLELNAAKSRAWPLYTGPLDCECNSSAFRTVSSASYRQLQRHRLECIDRLLGPEYYQSGHAALMPDKSLSGLHRTASSAIELRRVC